jgi:hypothetical protein
LSRLLVLAAMLTVGCAPPGTEEQQLRVFFEASRARDSTLLAKVATVSLNPVREGTVRDFELVSVGAEHVDGDLATKPVTVNVRLHTPQSETVSRTLVFTFQRKVERGQAGAGRWTITGFH